MTKLIKESSDSEIDSIPDEVRLQEKLIAESKNIFIKNLDKMSKSDSNENTKFGKKHLGTFNKLKSNVLESSSSEDSTDSDNPPKMIGKSKKNSSANELEMIKQREKFLKEELRKLSVLKRKVASDSEKSFQSSKGTKLEKFKKLSTKKNELESDSDNVLIKNTLPKLKNTSHVRTPRNKKFDMALQSLPMQTSTPNFKTNLVEATKSSVSNDLSSSVSKQKSTKIQAPVIETRMELRNTDSDSDIFPLSQGKYIKMKKENVSQNVLNKNSSSESNSESQFEMHSKNADGIGSKNVSFNIKSPKSNEKKPKTILKKANLKVSGILKKNSGSDSETKQVTQATQHKSINSDSEIDSESSTSVQKNYSQSNIKTQLTSSSESVSCTESNKIAAKTSKFSPSNSQSSSDNEVKIENKSSSSSSESNSDNDNEGNIKKISKASSSSDESSSESDENEAKRTKITTILPRKPSSSSSDSDNDSERNRKQINKIISRSVNSESSSQSESNEDDEIQVNKISVMSKSEPNIEAIKINSYTPNKFTSSFNNEKLQTETKKIASVLSEKMSTSNSESDSDEPKSQQKPKELTDSESSDEDVEHQTKSKLSSPMINKRMSNVSKQTSKNIFEKVKSKTNEKTSDSHNSSSSSDSANADLTLKKNISEGPLKQNKNAMSIKNSNRQDSSSDSEKDTGFQSVKIINALVTPVRDNLLQSIDDGDELSPIKKVGTVTNTKKSLKKPMKQNASQTMHSSVLEENKCVEIVNVNAKKANIDAFASDSTSGTLSPTKTKQVNKSKTNQKNQNNLSENTDDNMTMSQVLETWKSPTIVDTDSMIKIADKDMYKSLQGYISNKKMKQSVVKTNLKMTALRGKEIWLVQCPKEIPISSLTGQKFKIGENSKLKLKINSERYEVVSEQNKKQVCLLASMTQKKTSLGAKIINLAGTIAIHQLLKKPKPIKLESVSKTKVELPCNLKIRHPIFGSDYKKNIKIDKSVQEKLLEAEIARSKYENTLIKKKRSKSNNKNDNIEAENIIKDEMIFKLLSESERSNKSYKKSKKRKLSENQENNSLDKTMEVTEGKKKKKNMTNEPNEYLLITQLDEANRQAKSTIQVNVDNTLKPSSIATTGDRTKEKKKKDKHVDSLQKVKKQKISRTNTDIQDDVIRKKSKKKNKQDTILKHN